MILKENRWKIVGEIYISYIFVIHVIISHLILYSYIFFMIIVIDSSIHL